MPFVLFSILNYISEILTLMWIPQRISHIFLLVIFILRKSHISKHMYVSLVSDIVTINANKHVSQLLENLLTDYNKAVRPVHNASDALKVKFGANLCRLIDVDEVNQVLTTSLWLEMVRF